MQNYKDIMVICWGRMAPQWEGRQMEAGDLVVQCLETAVSAWRSHSGTGWELAVASQGCPNFIMRGKCTRWQDAEDLRIGEKSSFGLTGTWLVLSLVCCYSLPGLVFRILMTSLRKSSTEGIPGDAVHPFDNGGKNSPEDSQWCEQSSLLLRSHYAPRLIPIA